MMSLCFLCHASCITVNFGSLTLFHCIDYRVAFRFSLSIICTEQRCPLAFSRLFHNIILLCRLSCSILYRKFNIIFSYPLSRFMTVSFCCIPRLWHIVFYLLWNTLARASLLTDPVHDPHSTASSGATREQQKEEGDVYTVY